MRDFWPDLQAAQELHGSICQALQEKESEGSQKEFAEHLPAEILEAGIKSGRYIKVQGWLQGERAICLASVYLVSGQRWWTAPPKSCILNNNGFYNLRGHHNLCPLLQKKLMSDLETAWGFSCSTSSGHWREIAAAPFW